MKENSTRKNTGRDFSFQSPEMIDGNGVPADGFVVNRTINGIPVSGNDFLESCAIEDGDALRILLAARHRANGTNTSGIGGDNQITH